MSTSSPSKNISNKHSPAHTTQKMGHEINVRLYHKLLDGWAVEIIEVCNLYSINLITRGSNVQNTILVTQVYMRLIFYFLFQLIDKELSEKILRKSSTEHISGSETTKMMRQIFTLGELAQICPHRINKKMFLLMQSIIFQQV